MRCFICRFELWFLIISLLFDKRLYNIFVAWNIGVTDAEIEMAIDQSGTRQDVPKPVNQSPGAPPPPGQVPMATHPGALPQQQMGEKLVKLFCPTLAKGSKWHTI